jgi:uncharacterized membrane protein YgdD (TMEM256/DUF423 family)
MNTTTTAAILGATAVIAGAFGAHALKEVLNPEALNSYQTAVRYQMWHALALLLTGLLPLSNKALQRIGWCWLCGVLLFSGSIYLLHLGPLMSGSSWNFLGPVTPIGGLLLITGWVLLFATGLKKRK